MIETGAIYFFDIYVPVVLLLAELSTSTSWTSAFEFSSLLVLLPYLPGQLRLFLDRVELFARLSMIGA